MAVALQLCPLAVEFDLGGLICIPTSWFGVVGLAATSGKIHTAAIQQAKASPIAVSVVCHLSGLWC